MARNTAKNSREEPRSFSRTMTRIELPQARITGAKCFGSGSLTDPTRQVDLGRLPGLEVEGPEVDQQRGVVDLLPDAGDGGNEQRADPDQGERVAVALQIADAADGGQGGHEGADADGRPQRLVAGQVG